jgi:hypothetical protein
LYFDFIESRALGSISSISYGFLVAVKLVQQETFVNLMQSCHTNACRSSFLFFLEITGDRFKGIQSKNRICVDQKSKFI